MKLQGFSDPNWNWGSSMGTGHDAAMLLRNRLDSADKRDQFIVGIINGSKEFNLEDIKLALALRFQCAARESIAGGREGYEIMEKMAKRKYENGNGDTKGEDLLQTDLEALLTILPADKNWNFFVMVAGLEPGGNGEVLHQRAAQVLTSMKFSKNGC
eukprot:CAMPEP_0119041864 /NCGR_PEP_ID=MMETSP1177-20130426/14015_1 /TAXON_ID=2985 /ORGANISM="Ochromonas sp, Strain CCMP1899" /LENGTH=156 /DNA_ID=CAMNT_0007008237 /DNA_START=167 /DNA_END=637 /DNA_ORIENTATION=-